MTTCLLVRHGQSQANVDGVLAGHLESTLTEEGVRQARRVAEQLRTVPLRCLVTSPLSRCRATAAEIATARPDLAPPQVEERLAEVRYGAWTGRSLSELAREELWGTIQAAPSRVVFPADDTHAHEAMSEMSARAWAAWLDWDAQVAAEHGENAVWALVSHGDVIKAVLARALGLDLDSFQSIVVDPASVSIVHHAAERTAVTGLNLREDTFLRLTRTEDVSADSASVVGIVGGGNG